MATIIPQTEEARPVFRRDMQPRPQRMNFATQTLMRLALLAGQRCPNCGLHLDFDGSRLHCDECSFGWSNPDVAESEVYHGLC